MNLKTAFVYNRQNRLNKDGEALIQLRIHVKADSRFISTGVYIPPKSWNGTKVVRHSLQSVFNIKLRKIEDKIVNYWWECQTKDKELSAIELKNWYLGKDDKKHSDFFVFWSQFIDNLGLSKPESYYVMLNRVKKFHPNPLPFRKINYAFCVDHLNWLKTIGNNGKPYHPNTINKGLEKFSTAINEAIKLEYLEKNPIEMLDFSSVPTEKKGLTIEQFTYLKNLEVRNKLELSKDMFMFSCTTGLRLGDVIDLQEKHIKEGVVKKVMNKSITKRNPLGKEVELPLKELFGGYPYEIYKKYKTGSFKVFPKISTQYLNRNLKELLPFGSKRYEVLVKKDKLSSEEKTELQHLIDTHQSIKLTFHVSRHTFVSILSNSGVPLQFVQALAGHGSVKMTQKYEKKDFSKIVNALKNIS